MAVVEAVRKAVGPEIELLVDVHGTRDVSEAIELGRGLEVLGVRWLEAPCQPEDIRGQAEIARALSMQVATGEWLRTVWEWRDWIALRGFDVAMPDIARTGLSEGKRIAALCDSFNLPVSPHVGGGGILSVAATIHYSLAIPNFQIMEHGHESLAWKGTIAQSYPIPQERPFCRAPGTGPWCRNRRDRGGTFRCVGNESRKVLFSPGIWRTKNWRFECGYPLEWLGERGCQHYVEMIVNPSIRSKCLRLFVSSVSPL